MLSGETLTLLSLLASELRPSSTPLAFGGLQLVLSGDFLQLPPVTDSLAFESPAWKATIADEDCHFLTTNFRQEDERLRGLLNRMRFARLTMEDDELLKAKERETREADAKGRGDEIDGPRYVELSVPVPSILNILC